MAATAEHIGALAHIDDRKRLEALSLVRAGAVYDLSHELHEGVPVFPGRSFHQTLVTTAHHSNMGGLGDNEVNWITEVYASTSQLGTHLDSLAHLQRGMHGYGGIPVDELAGASGVNQLGAETTARVKGHAVGHVRIGSHDRDSVRVEVDALDCHDRRAAVAERKRCEIESVLVDDEDRAFVCVRCHDASRHGGIRGR
jgi:hypothetical protein